MKYVMLVWGPFCFMWGGFCLGLMIGGKVTIPTGVFGLIVGLFGGVVANIILGLMYE